jgi:hypothetical protein
MIISQRPFGPLAAAVMGYCLLSSSASALAPPRCETFDALGSSSFANDSDFSRLFKVEFGRLSEAELDSLLDTLSKCMRDWSTRPHGIRFLDMARANLVQLRHLRDRRLQSAKAAATKFAELMKALEMWGEEMDRLPVATESKERLAVIHRQLQTVGQVSSMADLLNAAGAPAQDKAIHEARAKLQAKLDEKLGLVAAVEIAHRKSGFIASGQVAAQQHRNDIASLGLSAKTLDATIFFERASAENRRFITLRHWVALLLARSELRITGVEAGSRCSIAVKRPGQRTLLFGFQIDGDDAFLSAIGIGDMEELMDTPIKQIQGERLLREIVDASMW